MIIEGPVKSKAAKWSHSHECGYTESSTQKKNTDERSFIRPTSWRIQPAILGEQMEGDEGPKAKCGYLGQHGTILLEIHLQVRSTRKDVLETFQSIPVRKVGFKQLLNADVTE